MGNVYLWSTNNLTIKLCEEIEINIIKISNIEDNIIKISNIDNHLFLLTNSNVLYHGFIKEIDNISELHLLKYTDHYIKDIECLEKYVYIVDLEGRVYKLTEDLTNSTLIPLTKCCSHGHRDTETNLKVRNLAVGNFGILFITTCGQLWACGRMPQIDIDSPEEPKKVIFFNGRLVQDISVGNDYAVALVSKQLKTDDTDSEDGEEDVFVSSCPRCIPITPISTPSSQNSLNELCPVDTSLEKSSSVLSSSKGTESSDSEQTRKFVQYVEESTDQPGKNIIARNTDYLTRQISLNLAKCTERPTRIIKENVSNMASLVFEGVKTVGETISRHVSGSSDTTEAAESLDLRSESGGSSRDDFLLSSSQCTSEKEFVEQNLQEKCNLIFKSGHSLLSTELWAWGNTIHGQLGIGDTINRDKPVMITKLSNIGVQKVHAKYCHTAVLTLDGRTFIWGENQYHQVSIDKRAHISSPSLFVIGDTGDRIIDVACGNSHTVILTSRNKLYYLGKLSEGSTEKIIKIRLPTNEENNQDIELKNLNRKIVKNKLLSTSMYTLYNNNINVENPLLEDIALEQIYLEELTTVQMLLIKPLEKKNLNTPDLNVYETLCRYYNEICYFTAANINSLVQYCNGYIPVNEIIMLKHFEEHLFMYKNYLKIICNIISVNGFLYISQIIDIPQQLYKLSMQKKGKKSAKYLVQWLFTHALNRLSIYCLIIQKLLRNPFPQDYRLLDIKSKWDNFITEQEKKRNEADITRKFWENTGKCVEDLRNLDRRLIKDSRNNAIFLSNAGRFSTHIFILLSDMFIHINGSSPITHNLLTVWAEPQQNNDNLQNVILLTMPEDTYQLYTTTSEEKSDWLQSIQNAIKYCLNKSNANQPPVIRTASYTFIKSPIYKDSTYIGRWLNGKMHGSGKLDWHDGRYYMGQFQNNQMHGYGRLENPSVGIYEGMWKDNQQNGRGIMKYITGDQFDGNFKDGQPHGHGVKKEGHHMAPIASLYIGEWVQGSRCGYGVMDDITNGEKYLGNWLDNKKHGNGLIVTSDGVYYAGVFNQDVLTGLGLMMFEDGAYYEGEFRAAGKFNGKGVLTLSSGYKIEGNLNGSWNSKEGIKISAGTLHLPNPKEAVNKPKSYEKFCVSGNQKWKAIFRVCCQLLGVPEASGKNNVKIPDTQKIWYNVAAVINNSRQGTLLRGDKKNKLQMQREQLDSIPEFYRKKIDTQIFKEVKQYLSKAFESPHHPLGSLLKDLTEAYTATYGGVIVHPLLLSHAVDELHSIIIRVYDIVRLLFPELPCYGEDIDLSKEDDESDIVCCASLLHSLLLPKVYSALFTLYTLDKKREDTIYWTRLREWHEKSDFTLMSSLNVDEKFLKCQNMNSTDHYSTIKDTMFTKAVETFQQLKTTFSPFEKLLVVRQTIKNMETEIKQLLKQSDYSFIMDDLLPLLVTVVVRARILQLGSEIQFMEDFMDPHLVHGEFDMIFTTLKASYRHILEEKSHIY